MNRLTVLASGSAGNATLLEVAGFGLLIDCGLHPRLLASRLAMIGRSWDQVHAVILTHTHSDHWKDSVLTHLRNRGIPLYAHPAQLDYLSNTAKSLASLHAAHLTRHYLQDQRLELAPGLYCSPVWVSHDSEPTFAFRIDHHNGVASPAWSVGYASDLGCASDRLIDAFVGVEVLAIEFNHDEKMERASSRPAYLVQRVLSDQGHLSNRQAAELTRVIAARSAPGLPSHLVQLHLSQDCNHPWLAESAGRNALADLCPAAAVITAQQDLPTRSIPLMDHSVSRDRNRSHSFPEGYGPRVTLTRQTQQPDLPGFGEG